MGSTRSLRLHDDSDINRTYTILHKDRVNMSNFSRPMPSHLRGQSMGASQQSTFLQQKIADKKTELANLKDLQALSGGLADQMQMLADKLQTLSDGTEGALAVTCFERPLQCSDTNTSLAAVAAVLSNWHNVLRAINMASSKCHADHDNNVTSDFRSSHTQTQG